LPLEQPYVHYATTCQSIRKTCDTLNTRPNLPEILLHGLETWLNDEPANFSKFPQLCSCLISHQNHIGWRQLFNGPICTEWSRLQDEYLCEQRIHTKKQTGQLWATQIITSIWDGWSLVWKIRNEVIHGHDQASRRHIQHQEVEYEVKAIYEDHDHLLPADQDHLFDDVDTHLTQSTTTLRNWLNVYQDLFTDSIAKAKRRALLGVRSIRTYFQPP
jgi:hypothetical protein